MTEMKELDRAGTFRFGITGWSVREEDTGSVGVVLDCIVVDAWNGTGWDQWLGVYDTHKCSACIYIVKKDKTISADNVKRLVESIGWDSNLSFFERPPAESLRVLGEVEKDEYKGKVRYRISWVNPNADIPGGGNKTVKSDRMAQLQAQYGGMFRAIGGTVGKAPPPPVSPVMAAIPGSQTAFLPPPPAVDPG